MVNQKKKLNNHKVFKLYKNNFTTTLIDTQQCDSKYICGGGGGGYFSRTFFVL